MSSQQSHDADCRCRHTPSFSSSPFSPAASQILRRSMFFFSDSRRFRRRRYFE
jgi:hypothetical protein